MKGLLRKDVYVLFQASRAQLLIELQHLIHEGELLVLELLADVLAHELRVLTDKTNVQHDIFSSILFLFPGLVHVPERFHQRLAVVRGIKL